MTEDEVVREVRAARDAFAASHAYDIRAMVAALREMGIASGRVVVPLSSRTDQTPNQTLQPSGAAITVPGLPIH